MGDQAQMKLLVSGARVWNAWRQSNPCEAIDLHDEDLSQMVLGITPRCETSADRTSCVLHLQFVLQFYLSASECAGAVGS